MTYYRIQLDGPIRTQGPDWDTTCTRVAGWRVWCRCNHVGRVSLIIERETGKYYHRIEEARTRVYEITRDEARKLWARRASRLIPILA